MKSSMTTVTRKEHICGWSLDASSTCTAFCKVFFSETIIIQLAWLNEWWTYFTLSSCSLLLNNCTVYCYCHAKILYQSISPICQRSFTSFLLLKPSTHCCCPFSLLCDVKVARISIWPFRYISDFNTTYWSGPNWN